VERERSGKREEDIRGGVLLGRVLVKVWGTEGSFDLSWQRQGERIFGRISIAVAARIRVRRDRWGRIRAAELLAKVASRKIVS